MSIKKPSGRTIPLSLPRRWVGDLTAFSQKVPTVAGERLFRVRDLMEARRSVTLPPGWCAIITRAFGTVSSRIPELRRSYLGFPFPRLYEHPVSVASLAINRDYHGEPAVFLGLMQAPENLSLQEIQTRVRQMSSGPIWETGSYRRLIRATKLPRPVRRLLWWYGLCASGKQKSTLFGTFSVNSVAAMRGEICQFLTPITSSLYYGRPDVTSGTLKIQVAIDHRVFDAVLMSRALRQLESVLNTEMAAEVACSGKSN